jgi:hypothetical protein
LRDDIIYSFQKIEGGSTFQRSFWTYQKGEGGGEMSVLRGKVFEKAAVNWSGVGGPSFPMDDASGAFFATGVSLITHMSNPKIPTVHMNVRFIQTEKKHGLEEGMISLSWVFHAQKTQSIFIKPQSPRLILLGRIFIRALVSGPRSIFTYHIVSVSEVWGESFLITFLQVIFLAI